MLTIPKIPRAVSRFGSVSLYSWGYWGLVLLVLSLPFELTQRPFFQSEIIALSNLKLVFFVVIGLGMLSLFKLSLVSKNCFSPLALHKYFYKRRWPLGLWLALMLAGLVSSLLSGKGLWLSEGLKWTIQLGLTGLLWLVIPLWLAGDSDRKIRRLHRTLVGGAVLAAGVGFLEFSAGWDFAESLAGWFKVKPTTAGPFLRLSGTFEYANIAALYFEMALPFAMLELVRFLTRPNPTLKSVFAGLMWLGALVALVLALLLTLSRGGWLGLALGLGVMLVAIRNTGQRRAWWLVLGLTGAIGLGLELLLLGLWPQFGLRFSSQSDQDWFKAAYSSALPSTLTVCQELAVPVSVKNLGPLDWQSNPTSPYSLSYHWLDASDAVAQFEGIRTNLTENIAAGGLITVWAKVRVPATPGVYSLIWDVVQPEVGWFSLKSAYYTKIPVQVNDRPLSEKGEVCQQSLLNLAQPTPFPKALPSALKQPNRLLLWKAALAMVAARPLFGVGPTAFRFNYGDFSQPRLTEWDERVYANNLPLEMFADLGLVGGGLYFALLFAILWSHLKLVWRGQGASGWQVALIGALSAFLGHGLLDYILGSNAIAVLLWVLLGLASTEEF